MIGTEFIPGQGLGNQLLCYVTARCIAKKRGVPFGLVRPELLGNVVHSRKGMYFMRLTCDAEIPAEEKPNYSILREKEDRIFMGNSRHDIQTGCYVTGCDEAVLQAPDQTLLAGNLQDEAYFGPYREDVKEWLRVLPEYDSHAFTADDLCIINLRGGEYVSQPELFLRRKYYLDAMRHMRGINPAMRFMIVTEDPEAAKKVLPEIRAQHFDLAGDYTAVKNARYLILSNSSFAVMPVFTSETVRMAIAPKFWARHNVSDGYWASEQNIYSFLTYQDRSGKLFTAQECRTELARYRETSSRYAGRNRPLAGTALWRADAEAKLKYSVYMGGRAVRSLLRRTGFYGKNAVGN